MAASIKDILLSELENLPESKLAEVLDFVRDTKALAFGAPYAPPSGMTEEELRERFTAQFKAMEKDLEECRRNMPKGATMKDLDFLRGSISKEDLDIMEKVIEEGCGQINYESW